MTDQNRTVFGYLDWFLRINTMREADYENELFSTVRPWDARFLGKEKTCAAQNSCNFCYLTAVVFETGAMPTPTKSQNPTICGWEGSFQSYLTHS